MFFIYYIYCYVLNFFVFGIIFFGRDVEGLVIYFLLWIIGIGCIGQVILGFGMFIGDIKFGLNSLGWDDGRVVIGD